MRIKPILILFAVAAFFGNAYANDGLDYILTVDKIKNVSVGKGRNGQYNVSVTLAKPYREDFKVLTEDNVGKKLRIIHRGKILVQAIIQSKIDSGIIGFGDSYTAEEAGEYVKNLLSD